ncbi:histidine kinase dimerization/phospho-acceptor domain-containing protein [Pseudoalteromonas sp. Hal099]
MLGELTTTLAHDINQPLSAITINSEAAGRWLAQSPINTHEIKQNLFGINKEAQKASDIIQCIYALAKKSPIDKTLVPINSIFSESFALMDGLINKTDVAIDYQGNSADCALFANKVALQQVIINLLLNSIQAFKHDQADKKISITVQINGPNIEIIMKDNGPGFKSDSASKFFNAFYITKKMAWEWGLLSAALLLKIITGALKLVTIQQGEYMSY